MQRIISLSVILTVLNMAVKGQDNILTIHEAVEIAYMQNPVLKQYEEQKKQQKLTKRTSTGILSPEFTYFKEGIDPNTGDFQEQRISIRQSIDFPLTSYYRLKSMDHEYLSLENHIEAQRRELKAEVKKQYIKVLYATHMIGLRETQLELTTDFLDAVKIKLEMGEATGTDLMSVEVQKDRAENLINTAMNNLHQARYDLFYLMGLDPEDQDYSIRFSDTLSVMPVNIIQDSALAFISRSPKLHSVEQMMHSSDYRIKEAKSDYLPDISFSYYKQDYSSGFNYNGFELGLSLPIWFPLNKNGTVKEEVSRYHELEWKRTEIIQEIKREIEKAWHGYSTLSKNINTYIVSTRDKALILRDNTMEAYRLGEIDLLKLLDAQRVYVDSESDYLTSLRDYYIQMTELEKFTDFEIVY